MSFDMNKLMQQAAEMQAQVQQMQEQAVKETAEASVGGGLVKVTANGAGAVLSITISPEAIDPSDPEALGDLVLAGQIGVEHCRIIGAYRAQHTGPEHGRQRMPPATGLPGAFFSPTLGNSAASAWSSPSICMAGSIFLAISTA